MRRRSPTYSPPRRNYGGRERSPFRGRGYRDAPCGLLVRNIPKGSRPEDLRVPFERFGRLRDVYLPKDFYTGEPRGFGFVQFLNPFDAAEAKRYMDRRMFNGREITVVFAEENRKRPEEMRIKERGGRGRMGFSGRRSPDRGHTPPGYHSPSPGKTRYSRSNDGSSRRGRYGSISPDSYGRDRGRSPNGFADAYPEEAGHGKIDRNFGKNSISERSYSPDEQTKSHSKQDRLRSPSPLPQSERYSRSPGRDLRSRSRSIGKSWPQGRLSPSVDSPPPRRQRHVSISRSRSRSPPPKRQRNRHSPDLGNKIY